MPAGSDPAVLITGASRGLGHHMAVHLADHGFRVFAGVRSDAAADALEDDGRIMPIRVDVTDSDQIQAAAAQVAAEVGDRGLAGLVNNAAVAPFGPVEHSPVQDIDATLRINVLGPAALIQATLPLLRLGGGRIINVSSINAILPVPYAAGYNASKAALESLSDSLRLELEPWGIPVVVVRPAAFDTDVRTRGVEWWRHRRQELPPEEQSRYADGFEMQERFIAVLNSRAGHPDEVAETVHRALTDPEPQTKCSLGPNMDDLLALASLPDAERERALAQAVSSLIAEPACG